MRNSTGGTSSAKRRSQQNIASNDEKNSAKKLVQARLPFKVIAPGSSPATVSTTTSDIDGKKELNVVQKSGQKDVIDTRKRKLSYESDDDVKSGQEADNISKENVEVSAAVSKKKKIATTSSSEVEVVSLLDDDDEDVNNTTVAAPKGKKKTTVKTPNTTAPKAKRGKGAGTPQTSSAQKDKGQSGSASKLQIKLPLNGGKKSKRRKSKVNSLLANTSSHDTSQQNNSCVDSSDDIEEVSIKLNPQKRTKLDSEDGKGNDVEETKENVKAICLSSEQERETDQEEQSESPEKESPAEIDSDKSETQISAESQNKSNANTTECEKSENKVEDPEDSALICSDDENVAGDEGDEDADDETENTSIKNVTVCSDISEDSKSKQNATIESKKDSENGSTKNKSLTPKQKKLMEQRQKAREEKERILQEEKTKKQQEKEEKDLARKREREEKEEQKRKEREEKEDQKRKEREEKERKRLAEVEAKNEEKRKRNEAKEEEIRKKEEERKRKELEKEEADIKKKKAAEAFTKFFVAKAPSNVQPTIEDDENTGDGTKALAFRPFQIKGDMKVAPLCRKMFTDEAKHRLDSLLGLDHANKGGESDKMNVDSDDDIVRTKPIPKSKLYISELRGGKILPGKWRRPSTESKDDVIIIEDELERVGEAIMEDTPAYVREEMRVKFYKFHDNRRPPYYGTWRKKSSVINAKKPFAQDKKFFDYQVDSDDEWEEEEPGESLEDGSDDDKEKESEDEDYEVDNEWFVPHGHLSDEEMQNEDELGNGDDNTREAQKAKLQILQQEFAQEMKKKTQKIKPRLIGCIWIDANGNQPTECSKIIWDTLNMRAMMCTDPPILDEPEVDEPSSPSALNAGNSEKAVTEKIKPITVTDAMLKDLIRLLHGNQNSKHFLIKEYIAYVEKTEETVKNGEFGNPLKTAIREKIDSIAEWQVLDATSIAETNKSDTKKKSKKKNRKHLCWVVNQETLKKMDMLSLRLQNTWEYILAPKLKLDKESKKPDEPTMEQEPPKESSNSKTVDKADDKGKNATPKIKKFIKVLTAEEIFDKLEKSKNTSTSKISPKGSKKSADIKSKSPTASASNPQISKEKKRVPLLISVGRGQQISTPAKNKLISQFLQKGNNDKNKKPEGQTNLCTSPVVDDDDVVILD